ncbi:MAG TPA: DDE-type integrase/transposase/recombinase [Polyangiaceae bacterium]|nr:DDE-type integrase/transposase/recombinase [Polyangiaceae bacterium]
MTYNPNDPDYRQRVALFRYGVIADVIHLGARKGLYAKLREKADRDYEIPGSRRRRIAVETLRGWLSDYRRGGFDALLPKIRRDNGLTRALPQSVVDVIVQLKDEQRSLSVPQLIVAARESGRVPNEIVLAPATVHRLLARFGLNKPESGATNKDRRHFAFEKAGELWMSDVMHGPAVAVDGKRKRKSYLIGLLDDATRLVPYAAFATSENTAAFLPVMEQAIRRRGVPKRLYVDNGAAYRSQHLALVCAKLGITLIHARPYQPAGKGKQERFFRTVRMQLMPLIAEADLQSLESLNRRLWAWIEGEYHHRPHRGLDGETPLDRWAARSNEVQLAPGELGELFLFETKRKVHKDRTVSLDGVLYEVEATLIGETVVLRYDPGGSRKGVQVWHEGRRIQLAKPVDAYANCFVRRDRQLSTLDRPPEPRPGLNLRDFTAEQEGE